MAYRAPDFFADMTRSDVERLEAFAREPKATVDKVHDWLLAEGFTRASRSAVGRWLKRFRESDRIREASEFADAIYTASAEAGSVDVAGGVNLQLAQRLQMALVKGGDKIAIGDLLKASMAINQISSSESRLRELKQKQAEALRAAEAKANSGATGVDVVATIKEALGITA